MFGMGGSEIIVILIVALLFLGPDKLPSAAKSISKGIRDIKKQSRSLQNQLEADEQIGGAIRDLKSALRGEEAPRPKVNRPKRELAANTIGTENTIHGGGDIKRLGEAGDAEKPFSWLGSPPDEAAGDAPSTEAHPEPLPVAAVAKVTLPASAGESDAEAPTTDDDDAELAAMIKPASGTVAKGS